MRGPAERVKPEAIWRIRNGLPPDADTLYRYDAERNRQLARRHHRIDPASRRCSDCGRSDLAIEAHTGFDRPICFELTDSAGRDIDLGHAGAPELFDKEQS